MASEPLIPQAVTTNTGDVTMAGTGSVAAKVKQCEEAARKKNTNCVPAGDNPEVGEYVITPGKRTCQRTEEEVWEDLTNNLRISGRSKWGFVLKTSNNSYRTLTSKERCMLSTTRKGKCIVDSLVSLSNNPLAEGMLAKLKKPRRGSCKSGNYTYPVRKCKKKRKKKKKKYCVEPKKKCS